jgi:hypothetical protein
MPTETNAGDQGCSRFLLLRYHTALGTKLLPATIGPAVSLQTTAMVAEAMKQQLALAKGASNMGSFNKQCQLVATLCV